MRRTERAAYRTKFYSNLSSPTRFDEEPIFGKGFIGYLLKRSTSRAIITSSSVGITYTFTREFSVESSASFP